MTVHDYKAIFKELTHRSDVREHHSETITRFIWGLGLKIRCVMIIGSYDLDTVEEAVEEAFGCCIKDRLYFKNICQCQGPVF